MNTNYKFTTRRRESPNSAQPYHPSYVPQNYVPCPPWQPCYGYPVATEQRPLPYNLYPQMYQPQQPMAFRERFLTNEDESFTIDLSPVMIKLNAFSYELTDKCICSIDFDGVRIETNASRYQHCGPLTVTAYIRKDGSIVFILWNPYAGNDSLDFYGDDEEEPIDLPNPKLYKRAFTTEEIKSVGDHCMEKLLVAFMNEALTATKNK